MIGSEWSQHRQRRQDAYLNHLDPVDRCRRRGDVVGISISQARPDHLSGPCHPVLRRSVGTGSKTCAFGCARDQGVANMQRKSQLEDGKEEQAQQSGHHGEIGYGGTGFAIIGHRSVMSRVTVRRVR